MSGLAVYAGSFDPPTNGHIWMIREGAKLFNRLVVSVGLNAEKRCTFPVEQRVEWLGKIVEDVVAELSNGAGRTPEVRVDTFENLFLAQYTESIGGSVMLRGIRNETDYTYERTMRHINADLHAGIGTVFLMPPRELCEVSSSVVKGMIGPKGWPEVVSRYLPGCVFEYLVEHHGR